MGRGSRRGLCVVAALCACVRGMEPRAGGVPATVCVDERGEVIPCAAAAAAADAPVESLQAQFAAGVARARQLKGLEDATDVPLSLSRRRKAERKAAQAEKREQRRSGGGDGACAAGEGGGDCAAGGAGGGPRPPAPTFSPGCAPGDKICDRRARQARHREEHARAQGEREVGRLARAAQSAAHAASVERYYADADLAAALDADLRAAEERY